MASYGKKSFSILIFSIFIVYVQCTELNATRNCSEQCQKTYAPESSISQENILVCARGCRFFSIARFIKKEGSTVADYEASCKESCREAYPSVDDPVAPCIDGCKFQAGEKISTPLEDAEETSEEKPEEQSMMTRLQHATPVLQIRKVMAQVIGGFHVIRTQVMTYFVQDDNTLIAVESPPQIMVDMAKDNEGVQSSDDLLHQQNSQQDLGNEQRDEDSPFISLRSPSETVTRVSLNNRRYAYLMHLLLLLAGVSVVLLGISYCLALVRHQQRRTLKAANLNLALQQEPLKLVRPEDLTKLSLMEEEEAPPLPNKQDFDFKHAQV